MINPFSMRIQGMSYLRDTVLYLVCISILFLFQLNWTLHHWKILDRRRQLAVFRTESNPVLLDLYIELILLSSQFQLCLLL